jgi:GNAT superfamily N-acetyltransferase
LTQVARLDAAAAERELDSLAAILADAVEGGASVGFVTPFSTDDAAAWWRALLPAVASGSVQLLGASLDGGLVGTVQLHPAGQANGRHRAEVAKLLVHRSARRRGVGRALMEAVEALAGEQGRTLLVLDTQTGSDAERLYTGLGWTVAGVIPGYSRLGDGSLGATTYLYKRLEP